MLDSGSSEVRTTLAPAAAKARATARPMPCALPVIGAGAAGKHGHYRIVRPASEGLRKAPRDRMTGYGQGLFPVLGAVSPPSRRRAVRPVELCPATRSRVLFQSVGGSMPALRSQGARLTDAATSTGRPATAIWDRRVASRPRPGQGGERFLPTGYAQKWGSVRSAESPPGHGQAAGY